MAGGALRAVPMLVVRFVIDARDQKELNFPTVQEWRFDVHGLQRARERSGLTRSGLARRMRPMMAGNQIAAIEENRQGLTITTLLRLCSALNLNPRSLFVPGGTNDHHPGAKPSTAVHKGRAR